MKYHQYLRENGELFAKIKLEFNNIYSQKNPVDASSLLKLKILIDGYKESSPNYQIIKEPNIVGTNEATEKYTIIISKDEYLDLMINRTRINQSKKKGKEYKLELSQTKMTTLLSKCHDFDLFNPR